MATPIRQLFSQTAYNTDGTTTVWDFSFAGGYLDKAHVKVQLLEIATGIVTQHPITLGDFIGPFQLDLTPAFPEGYELTIYRQSLTDTGLPLVDFQDKASITEATLDLNAKQAIFVAAESADGLNVAINSVSQIVNFVAEAEAAADEAAANAALTAADIVTSAANAAAAAGSAIAADASADSAAASAVSADASADAAAASAAAAGAAVSAAMASSINGATSKATPVDADELALTDSAASFGLKKLTWLNLKDTLKTYFDTVYATASAIANFAQKGGNSDITSLTGLTTPVSLVPMITSVRNWRAESTGVGNYNVVCTADEVVLRDALGKCVVQTAVNKTIAANGTVGAPLSIMSARAASTWYYIWLWYNASLGLTATLDISSTAPTAPTGYVSGDYRGLMPGARRTDASGSTFLLGMVTRGLRTFYVVQALTNVTQTPRMSSGVLGSPPSTYVAIAVGTFVPPTASMLFGDVGNASALSTFAIAPSANYGPSGSGSTNPAPVWQNVGSGDYSHESFEIELLSSNIYAFNQSGGYINCRGWQEAL